MLNVSPKGPLSSAREAQSIVVIFDRPMAALESLPEGPGPSLLKMAPSVDGKTRWLGTRTLAFTPDRRLPFATDIKVTVPAGTRALDGSYLKDDFSWGFQTMRPRLVQNFPRTVRSG